MSIATHATGRLTVGDLTGFPVVVGSDGSYWGDTALLWAAEHAWRAGAELEVWVPGPSADLPADIPRDTGISHITSAQPMLRTIVREYGPEPVVDLAVAGSSSRLLVIGHHGHHAKPMGELLVEAARCDVVVVRGQAFAIHGGNRRITALLSGRPEDLTVLRRAAAMAHTYRAGLRVAHECWDTLDQAANYLAGLNPPPAHTVVLVALPAEQAMATETDLLVVDPGDPDLGLALRQAPCPVLVTRRG